MARYRNLATLWPDGLVSRVMVVLLAALALEFAGSSLLYEQTNSLLPSAETLDALAGRLAQAERSLAGVPPASRSDLAAAMSGDGIAFQWDAATLPPIGPTPLMVLLRRQLEQFVPDLAARELRFDAGSWGPDGLFRDLSGSLRLTDGSALRFRATGLVQAGTSVYDVLLSTALLAGAVMLAALMVVATLGSPLRRLARVASDIGRGPPIQIAETGPREVREMARALNTMQVRIAKLVDDRTEALAAVSHDLRTPIARMRLRVEAEPQGTGGTATLRDLSDMEGMISAVLAFLGGERDPEPRRKVDLASIAQTVADQAADAGSDVTYVGPARFPIVARPLEIKRAIGNLVDNAVKYGGGSVRVSLSESPSPDLRRMARVSVEDRGPGIPPDALEQVLEPFHRVDSSRGSGRGGIGLGLAIVRRAAERDGGWVTLRNRDGGGLCAALVLPSD